MTTRRPQWDDRFLHDLPALERFAAEMRAWQRTRGDSFEKADEALWGMIDANPACQVFNHIVGWFEYFDIMLDLKTRRRSIRCVSCIGGANDQA
jgi:hypothetical protein